MIADREDLIRQRAYDLWDKDGRPDGMDQEYWFRAEREIAQTDGGSSPLEIEGPGAPGMATPEPLGDAAEADPVPEIPRVKARRPQIAKSPRLPVPRTKRRRRDA